MEVYKFLAFYLPHYLHHFLFFYLPAEVISSTILFRIKSPVASAAF